MSCPFRNDKRCRSSYLNNRPSIYFSTEDVLPFSKQQAMLLFFFNSSPLISFLIEDVLPLFEMKSVVAIRIWIIVLKSLFQLKMSWPFWNNKLCRYSYLNNIPSISFCAVAIRIRICVKLVWISADGIVERRYWTDDSRYIYELFRTETV